MIWLLPLILPKIANVFAGVGRLKNSLIYKRGHDVSSRELLCICTLLLFSCSTILNIFESSTNSFFQITKISKNSAPYILRHSYQNFISNWKESDVKFNEMLRIRAEREEAELFDDFADHKFSNEYSSLEAKYSRLDKISKKLLSKKNNVNIYNLYGEDVLFNNDDFLNSFGMKELFVFPLILKQYILLLVCVMVLSLFTYKKMWSYYAFIVSFICISSEFILLFYPTSNIPLGSFEKFLWNRDLTTLFDQVNILRNIILLFTSIFIVLFDCTGVEVRTATTKLQSSLLSLQSSIAKLQLLKFLQSLPKICKSSKLNVDKSASKKINNSEILIMKTAIKNRLKSIGSNDPDFFDDSFFDNYFKVK